MKIAIWHNLPSGGGKRALHGQVRGLKARGHDIEVWCPPGADRTYLPLAELVPEHVVPLHYPVRTDWDKRLRVPARVEPALEAMEDHCRACTAEIAAGSFDILLAHSCMYFRATPIGRFISIPKALYQHEPFRWLYEAQTRLPWLAPEPSRFPLWSLGHWRDVAHDRRSLRNARIQGRAELRNAAAFDRILVNSLFSRESILRAYGLDAEVCSLGIDLTRFTDRGWPREPLVLGLGAFIPEKNLDLAIEAMSRLPAPRPMLVWIGNVASEPYLSKMIERAAHLAVPFDPRTRVTDEDIVSLLNRASAMVYAPRLEPFGLAVLEAAACGLPVVAVAEGGVRETVIDGETGLLVPNTADATAAALARLLNDPNLARRLGAAARANAERNWSLEAGTDRIEQALQRIAGR
jgi:glycosyltransferase involved in cell wall biosynthesis